MHLRTACAFYLICARVALAGLQVNCSRELVNEVLGWYSFKRGVIK